MMNSTEQGVRRKKRFIQVLALLWFLVFICCITAYALAVRDLQRRTDEKAFIESRLSTVRSAVRPGMEEMFDSNAQKIISLTEQLYTGYGQVANLTSVTLVLSLLGLVLNIFYAKRK